MVDPQPGLKFNRAMLEKLERLGQQDLVPSDEEVINNQTQSPSESFLQGKWSQLGSSESLKF